MEKKGNNSLIIIALLLIFIGVGFYLYNNNIAKDKTNKEENNSKTEEVETKKETQQVTQIINTNVGTFIISKDGSVYFRKTVDKYAGVEIVIDDRYDSKGATIDIDDFYYWVTEDSESIFIFDKNAMNNPNPLFGIKVAL